MAIEASKAKTFEVGHEDDRLLRLPEAFHMATKVGGALFGKVGSFEPGYEFDALVIREDESPLICPWRNVLNALSTRATTVISKNDTWEVGSYHVRFRSDASGESVRGWKMN